VCVFVSERCTELPTITFLRVRKILFQTRGHQCGSPRNVLYESDKTLSANSYLLNKGRKCERSKFTTSVYNKYYANNEHEHNNEHEE